MRDYGRLASSMWTRGSGKRIRGNFAAQAVACYLASAPGSNMLGLYHITLATIASEMGHSVEAVREALAACAAAELAFYDEDAELAWIPNVAGIELGDGLEVKDKRRKGIVKHLAGFGKHRFVRQFLAKYGAPFGLISGQDAPDASPPPPPYSTEEAGNIPPCNGAGAGAGAGAVSSPGVQGGPPPADEHRPRAASSTFGMEGQFWADGVASFTSVPCAPPSTFDLAELVKATVHTALRGQALNDWYRDRGRAYAEATHALRSFWGLTAKSFVRWMSEGQLSAVQLAEARASPRKGRTVQGGGVAMEFIEGKDF